MSQSILAPPKAQGSTVPNAKFSTIHDLIVNPPTWEAHPRIERCVINNCVLNALSSSTSLERSTLTDSTVASTTGAKTGKSQIERSILKRTHVTDSDLDRSTTEDATLKSADLNRSNVSGIGSMVEDSRLERSIVSESSVIGQSRAERSEIKNSVINEKSSAHRSKIFMSRLTGAAKVSRCVINDSHVEKSNLERTTLTDCEVANCRMERTNFVGMRLANGKWDRGNLVGRIGDGEVICEKIDGGAEREMKEQQEMQRLQEPLQPTNGGAATNGEASHYGFPPDQKSSHPNAPESLSINIQRSSDISKHPDEKHEHAVTSPISDAGWSSGLPDAETEHELDTYDGPRTQTPPPPYEV